MNKTIRNFGIRILPIKMIEKARQLIHPQKAKNIYYNLGVSSADQKRILFSYVPNFLGIKDWKELTNSRDVECSIMLSTLVKLGFVVDIIHLETTEGIRDDYDYIFGSGKAFRQARLLNPKAKAILYLTEKTPDYSFKKECERIEYLSQRHSIKVSNDRSGLYYNNTDFESLDACVMIGTPSDKSLLAVPKAFTIYPTGLFNGRYQDNRRNYALARTHFLWMGSRGAVHKGLDILFDVFSKHPELTLHVAGLNSIDKKQLLPIMPTNVIDHGFVNISSDIFLEIAYSCAFIVSISCSEGVGTAVITGMNHGLIPLVTKETSIELEEIGQTFDSYKVEDVDRIIDKWSKMNMNILNDQAISTQRFSKKKYGRDSFANSFKKIASEIFN